MPAAIFFGVCFFASDWYSAGEAKWLFIVGLVIICLLESGMSLFGNSFQFDRMDAVAGSFFCAVSLTMLWSSDPLSGIDTLYKWGMLTLVFLGLRHISHEGTELATAGAIGIALIVIVINSFSLSARLWGGFDNYNFTTEALLLGMPFLLYIYLQSSYNILRWGSLTATIVIFTYLLANNPSKIEFITFPVLGIFLAFIFLFHKSRLLAVAVAGGIFGIISLTVVIAWNEPFFMAAHGFQESVQSRIELAVNSLAMWRDAPWLGYGVGGFQAAYPPYQEVHFKVLGIPENVTSSLELNVNNNAAHNEFLQFLVNFGLSGIALVVIAVYLSLPWLRTWRESPRTIVGMIVVLACLANSLVEFPLQNPATAMLAMIGLAWLFPVRGPENTHNCEVLKTPVMLRFGYTVAVSGISALLIWWGLHYAQAQRAFFLCNRTYAQPTNRSLSYAQEAYLLYPYSVQFRRQLILSLNYLDELNNQINAPSKVYDEYFKISATTGLTTGVLFHRLKYLMLSRRYIEMKDEVLLWRKELMNNSTRVPDVWLLDAIYEEALGNGVAIEASLSRYIKLLDNKQIPDNRKDIVTHLRNVYTGRK
jgi:hypothetical protein